MKMRTLLIAAAAATLALASSMVVCAKDGDIVPPRYKSNCDLMRCSGQHISVKDPARDLDLYFCVPQNLTYSVDEYQQKVAAYLADKAENEVVEEAPVVVEEVTAVADSDYFAPPRQKSSCDLMGCSGQHISVKDPARDLDLYFCVPQNLTYSVEEYQQMVAAYLAEKAGIVEEVVVEEAPAAEVVEEVAAE